ncbi:MAG: glutamine--tRNA ligase/YqeY domain fusion protein [Gammaproteobacteria bacterium]
MNEADTSRPSNFIHNLIESDLAQGGLSRPIATRFPPEPNGYLHIGHAKSICLNFSTAEKYQGFCNLRFDDTNPDKESLEFQEAIKADVEWLGYRWRGEPLHASDYFDQLFEFAKELIKQGKAYVDDLSADEIRDYRGTLTEPGRESPARSRSVDENLALFEQMANGVFDEGSYVLRAKIDMSSPNINLRDPTIYRIRKSRHHRTGDKWKIYPMYDYTHCISDALELITHSLCTLEFEDHRPLYDWFLDQLDVPCHPRQIEFARLELDYTITSKRKLQQLVADNLVDGWDDPRLPTLQGIRRRGYPPVAIREFCDRVGVTKKSTTIETTALETCVREVLDKTAARAMAVLDPVKIVITDYSKDKTEIINAKNHPKDDSLGHRPLSFSRELFVEREDFMEEPPAKYFRLAPGKEVRLRYAYIIKCHHVIKDDDGKVTEVHCTHDPDTLGKKPADGRKVKGIIHWVDARTAVNGTVRLYDRLFDTENPAAASDFTQHLNPSSLQTVKNAKLETSLCDATPETVFQFERLGYFCADRKTHRPDKPVFNRTTTLRDTWAKIEST